MQIDIGRLPEEGADFSGEVDASILDLADDDLLRTDAPVRCALRAQIISRELIVTGRLDTRVDFCCSRCGKLFVLPVSIKGFERLYDLDGDEVPWVKDDPESVDLTADIREAIILHFPAYPVCRGECRGLCPSCGTDLNEASCNCTPPPDVRWNELDKITAG